MGAQGGSEGGRAGGRADQMSFGFPKSIPSEGGEPVYRQPQPQPQPQPPQQQWFVGVEVVPGSRCCGSELCTEDCGSLCMHCNCCGSPCDRVCCLVDIHRGYRASSIALLVMSIVQFGAGLSVFVLAANVPGAGAWWCAIPSVTASLLGVYASCNVCGVTSFFLLGLCALVVNIIGLCVDGPRLTEFTSFRECCTLGGLCKDPPGYSSVGDPLRDEREATLLSCLHKPRSFFYPDDPTGDDPMPSIACATVYIRQKDPSLQYGCTQRNPDDSPPNNIFFFTPSSAAAASKEDPSWLWNEYAPRLRFCTAVDVLCLVLCLVVTAHASWVLCKKAACRRPVGGGGGGGGSAVHPAGAVSMYAGGPPLYAAPAPQSSPFGHYDSRGAFVPMAAPVYAVAVQYRTDATTKV